MDGFGTLSKYLDKYYLHNMALRISGELPRLCGNILKQVLSQQKRQRSACVI
jgi:hypothetical protein